MAAFNDRSKIVVLDKRNNNSNSYAIDESKAELEAAIKALELLKEIEKIRIITDSQYVRKGLTEWLSIWSLNNFKTINGEAPKNIEKWLTFDKSCNGKYIEFQWVKAHYNHFENSLCDMDARDAANQIK